MSFKNTIKLFAVIFLLFGFFTLTTIRTNAEYQSSDKPLFVIVSTDWCYACKILHPVINELESQYNGQVNFLHLNASNDDAVNNSRLIAAQYGLAAYFDSNRNVFPKVGILCPGSTIPEKIIIGANNKETYIDAINTFILDPNKICNVNGRPQETANGPNRPNEPQSPEVIGGRPDTPNFSDRPNETIGLGRPNELSFWTAGQPIPMYAYYQYLIIPQCSGNNNLLCSNGTSLNNQSVKNSGGSIFKPYDPNATRNEKGYHF